MEWYQKVEPLECFGHEGRFTWCRGATEVPSPVRTQGEVGTCSPGEGQQLSATMLVP